jgi:hypothetical protein
MGIVSQSVHSALVTDPALTVRGELVPSEIGAVELARRGARLALGAAALGVQAMVVGLSRTGNPEAAPPGAGLVPNAAMGFALESQRLTFDALAFGTRSARTVGRTLGRLPLVRESIREAVGVLEPWSARGIESGLRARTEAQDLIDAIIPRIADAVVARVDLDAIIDRIDYDAVIDRVPIDRVLDRVDYNSVVDRLDLTGIVADSTSGIAGESLDTVRLQTVRVDRIVSRIVDVVLRRNGGRRLPEP